MHFKIFTANILRSFAAYNSNKVFLSVSGIYIECFCKEFSKSRGRVPDTARQILTRPGVSFGKSLMHKPDQNAQFSQIYFVG